MTEGDFVKVLRHCHYRWWPMGSGPTAYVIDLTSQAWRDMAERRQVSPQVHHRGARDSGHGAVPALPTQARG